MKKNLCGVSYTAKGSLHGVSYTVKSHFGGVRYTGEAIAKQMKATTAFKGTILQKTDQNLTLLSNSMMNMNLKSGLLLIDSVVYLTPRKRFHIRISLWIFGKNRNRPSVPIMGPGEAIWWKNQHQKILWHCPFNVVCAPPPIFCHIDTPEHCLSRRD
jgi:hypothetical protein